MNVKQMILDSAEVQGRTAAIEEVHRIKEVLRSLMWAEADDVEISRSLECVDLQVDEALVALKEPFADPYADPIKNVVERRVQERRSE